MAQLHHLVAIPLDTGTTIDREHYGTVISDLILTNGSWEINVTELQSGHYLTDAIVLHAIPKLVPPVAIEYRDPNIVNTAATFSVLTPYDSCK